LMDFMKGWIKVIFKATLLSTQLAIKAEI